MKSFRSNFAALILFMFLTLSAYEAYLCESDDVSCGDFEFMTNCLGTCALESKTKNVNEKCSINSCRPICDKCNQNKNGNRMIV